MEIGPEKVADGGDFTLNLTSKEWISKDQKRAF
jgi:hypothetical protein